MKLRTCLHILLPLGAAVWIGLLAHGAAADTTADILEHAAHSDQAASQARAIGWSALAIAIVNLGVLLYIVLRLMGRGWSLLGDAEWPVRSLHRRQVAIGRSLAELNAHFQDVDVDRQQLGEILRTINERVEGTNRDVEVLSSKLGGRGSS